MSDHDSYSDSVLREVQKLSEFIADPNSHASAFGVNHQPGFAAAPGAASGGCTSDGVTQFALKGPTP